VSRGAPKSLRNGGQSPNFTCYEQITNHFGVPHLAESRVGTISYEEGSGNQNPQVKWVVQDKDGCLELVQFLTVFPLRAKKLRDFLPWAEAVYSWHEMKRGNRWHGRGDYSKLLALKKRIESTRAYRDPPWSGNGFQDFCREWAEQCLRVLKPGGHLLAFGGPRTYHRLASGIEDAGFELRDQIMWIYASGFPKSHNLEGEWEGWGTALKPAHEPLCMARKPLIGTVAENVTTYGVGALNIDGCRVPSGSDHASKCASVVGLASNRNGSCYSEWQGERNDSYSPLGRCGQPILFMMAATRCWPTSPTRQGKEEAKVVASLHPL
jgi:hypothetical protein